MRRALQTVAIALLVTAALGVAAGSLGGLSADLGPDEGGVRSPDDPGDGSAPSSAATGGDSIGQATYLRLLAALLATALVCCYVLFPSYRRVVVLTGGAGTVGAAGYLLYRPSATVSVPTFGTSDALGLVGAGVLVGLVLAGAGLLWRFDGLASRGGRSGDDERPTPGGERHREAGEHPASAPADDPVRQAWQRMVADLRPPSPGARTPGEFADTAKDAGRDPDAVDRLTSLFRAVRYGRREPDECRDEARRLADRAAGDETAVPTDGAAGGER
ncbi:DUF4129 domain-containing protein [Haloarchaeobius iranensis]|uniref:Protein-glutamine gamma-glutamyltransferase-like C-terminal domain-containing protein n=1 Tax=Haloarchaeobius iranensis TaxID=996166 RepID=A0A1G9X2T9_9EURY|nr:DUF4129 domain-containing protein [Haloarchaeobius iranensis]SDM91084.1 protein of unknown function [Haloarchaeobius iranensis]